MTVQVNSLSATALAVGQAFAQSRPSPSKAEGRRERAPGPWPAIASAFVEQRRKERKERQGPPAETWDELYVAFTAAYDAHYVSMRSFREACYRYEKERESLRSVTTGETDEEDS